MQIFFIIWQHEKLPRFSKSLTGKIIKRKKCLNLLNGKLEVFFFLGRRAKENPSWGKLYLSVQTDFYRNKSLFSTQVPHLCIKGSCLHIQIRVMCCQTKPHFVFLGIKSRKILCTDDTLFCTNHSVHFYL